MFSRLPIPKDESLGTHKRERRKKQIFVDTINGYQDHCHCLISLSADQTMSRVMQLVKGESSYWINKQGLCKKKFEWQDEYFAGSVSESMLGKVREYIKNQEDHHKKIPFHEEYDQFIEKLRSQKL